MIAVSLFSHTILYVVSERVYIFRASAHASPLSPRHEASCVHEHGPGCNKYKVAYVYETSSSVVTGEGVQV